jgi:hypothetical protein
MKKIILLGLLLNTFCFVKAQKIFIKESNGTQTGYLISNVKMMRFLSGSIEINKTDESFDLYYLNELRCLHFTDLSTDVVPFIPLAFEKKFIVVQAYPNPVSDLLNIKIQFSKTENQPVEIEIFSIEGKIVYKQNTTPSDKIYQINTTSFSNGFYLCKIKTELITETIKFIKQ